MSTLKGEFLEILEMVDEASDVPIVPTVVRLNGVPLLIADRPIVIDAIEVPSNSFVLVTMTLICRRVVIGEEVRQ